MRLAAKRLQRLLQRIQRGTRIRQHLLALIQHMQTVEAQRADDNDVAIVALAVRRGAFRQAGI
ncbi:hypothetical protein D3C81_2187270 [compost metagenome]